MNKKEIDNAIADILMIDGPDGHCDGSDVITDFILAIIGGYGESWIRKYREKNTVS